MLFSDIEGSTVLLRGLGDRYGEALSAQRALLRAAFSSFGGQEMGTEGDSFFVVFQSARDAVRCCVAAQRALPRMAGPAGSRCGSGWVCIRGSPPGTKMGTSGWMSIGRYG